VVARIASFSAMSENVLEQKVFFFFRDRQIATNELCDELDDDEVTCSDDEDDDDDDEFDDIDFDAVNAECE
jgi:hypothetical protein